MFSRRKIFFQFIFLMISNGLHAQGIEKSLARLKDIHSQSASITKDSALAFEYNYLAEAYSGKQDSLAMRYIDSLRLLTALSPWKKSEGLYLRALGKYHDRRGEFDQALENYTQAIESFEKQHDQSDFLAYTYILKAFVLNNNGLYAECEKTLDAIRPLAERLPNKNFLAWIIDAYGDHSFYSAFGALNYNKALDYYLQVEKLLPEVRSEVIKADNAHGLAGCYLRLGDEKKATYYTDLALKIALANNNMTTVFAIYGDMADVFEEKGQFDQAIAYRLRSLEYARQTNWIEMETRAERNAAYTYKLAGDFKNAFLHFEKLKFMEDSLARFEVQNKYHELELKYESGKKDLQIQQLKSSNLQLYLYVSGALLLGGGLFLIYYRNNNRKLIQHNKELYQKNLEIQMALTEGQNIERKRMAIELHDNINAKIAAAKWMMETINTPDKTEEEKQVIDRLVDAMSDIYEDVRFISHNLVPKELETKNLSEIIRQLIQNLNHNQKIAFSFQADGNDDNLATGLKLQCYAMIMELINNTIKHSGCRNASVGLHFMKDAMTIHIEDDGKGFDPEMVNAGVGLKNLATRINTVRGKMTIAHPEGKGTVIDLSIPMIYQLESHAMKN